MIIREGIWGERERGFKGERVMAVDGLGGGGSCWKMEEEKKRKESLKINILLLLNWPDIRLAPNGAQKLQKIENIILRRNMKTV